MIVTITVDFNGTVPANGRYLSVEMKEDRYKIHGRGEFTLQKTRHSSNFLLWQNETNFKLFKQKSLAHEARQKNDISERKSKDTLFATRLLDRCATCKKSSYNKKEYNLFYHAFGAECFFSTIFSKKAVFSEKTMKNCFRGKFDHFLGKGRVLPKNFT